MMRIWPRLTESALRVSTPVNYLEQGEESVEGPMDYGRMPVQFQASIREMRSAQHLLGFSQQELSSLNGCRQISIIVKQSSRRSVRRDLTNDFL